MHNLQSQFCTLQEDDSEEEGISVSADGNTLTVDGVAYAVGDHVYVHPETFDQLEQAAQAEVPDYAAKGRFHKVRAPLMSPSFSAFQWSGLIGMLCSAQTGLI